MSNLVAMFIYEMSDILTQALHLIIEHLVGPGVIRLPEKGGGKT